MVGFLFEYKTRLTAKADHFCLGNRRDAFLTSAYALPGTILIWCHICMNDRGRIMEKEELILNQSPMLWGLSADTIFYGCLVLIGVLLILFILACIGNYVLATENIRRKLLTTQVFLEATEIQLRDKKEIISSLSEKIRQIEEKHDQQEEYYDKEIEKLTNNAYNF